MEYKKTIILLALVVFLLSIAGVSASEIDDTLASEDTNTIGLSADNDIGDNLQTSEEKEALASTDYDGALSAQTDTEVLGADSAKYSDLAEEIGHSGNITLTHKNYTYDEGETITISEANKVIDGNGAVIDMNGSTIRAFHVSASGVTIKNLTIKNANYDGYGGAIYFDSTGTVTNCNFVDNKVTGDYACGGAVYFYSTGTVSNCNFADNTAYRGGAVFFYSPGIVTNCNFVDNKVTGDYSYGGAISMVSGNVTNCYFADNSASNGGAILSLKYLGIAADTCIFKTDSDTTFNTHNLPPTLNVNNFTTVYGSGEKLTFDLKTNSSIPVTNGNISISVYSNNEWVGNYACLSGEGWIPDLLVGSYIAVFNTEYAEFQKVNRTVTITMPSDKYYVNVTSLTTNNKTVNITAKTNVPKDIIWEGKLLFILSNGTEINATYAADGIWWAVHTFDDYGDYQVNASYNGLDNVTIHNATISISKSNSAVNVSDVVLNYGESTNVTVTTEGSTGVTAKINDTTVTVINNYTIPISGLDVGTYTLTVTTIPDANHCEVTRTANITVTKANPEIRMNVTLVADTAIIDVTVPADATGNVTVRIGERVYMENVSYGRALLIVAGLGVGNYTVHVNYNGDKNYASNNNSTKLEVCPIKMDEKDILVADYGNGTVIVVVFKNATGNITVKVGNNTYNSAIVDGMAVFNIDNETPGTHDVDVIYWGDENHEGNSIVSTITVPKYDSPISVDAQSIEYGIPAVIMVYLLENTTGNVSIEIDGVRYSEELIDGVAQFLIENLTAGIKTAYVDYTGDDNYAGKHTTVNITVTKANPEIMMNVTLDGDTAIIDVTAPEDVANPVVVDVDGVGYYANITSGKGQLVLPSMAGGWHYVTARYSGDNRYNQSEPQFKSFEICDVPSEVSVKVDNITYGDKAVIEVTVPADATGNVTVTIDGKDYIENVSCAKAIFIVAGLGAGNYTVDVTYDGDEKYASSKTSAELEVSKAKTFIKVIDMGNGTVIVVVSDNVSSNVTIKVGNNSYGAAVEDGIAMINLVNETYGVHDIEVICDGDENHTAAYANASITLNKFKTLIIANAITTTYNVNKDLVISLIDVKGNPISGAKIAVDLNGVKTYTTDKNGQVKVSTKGLDPKTYTAKITFNGNTNYDKSSKNVKVTVKKATPKLTAKKKTYKTTTKTKKYTIVLKDNVGKAIKKAKVTLKVKGKTYKAKTNSKGKATFKIKNLKKKGTFKAVIKYKGNKYYKKLTKKVKIKVIVKFKTVSRGSKDKATVKEIQQALKDNGYYLTYQGHYLKIDGKFSSCTVRSIKQFQHDKGLKTTGKVDEKTAIKLGILK